MDLSQHQSRLIFLYNKHCNLKPSEAAKVLVAFALDKGVIKRAFDVSGNRLKMWALHGDGPDWACRAAYLYLLEIGFTPEDPDTLETFQHFNLMTAAKGDGR